MAQSFQAFYFIADDHALTTTRGRDQLNNRIYEVAGRNIYQAYIGSSAIPGLRDFAVPSLMLDEKQVHNRVSLDINPASRQILENLANLGLLEKLIRSGARILQADCNGCIGMGQPRLTGKLACDRFCAIFQGVPARRRIRSIYAVRKQRPLR